MEQKIKIYEDEREILITKNVYLVQKCKFFEEVPFMNENDMTEGLNSILQMKYMGASEFEYDAIAHSTRRIRINRPFYKVFIFDMYKDKNGNSLKVFAPELFITNVMFIVNQLIENGFGLKVYCPLSDYLKDKELDSNFWWDIENDFYMFFNNTVQVIQAVDSHKVSSDDLDIFGKLSDKEKQDYYLQKHLLAPYSVWGHMKTSISNYLYDSKEDIYHIVFHDNIPLSIAIVEAMVIANISSSKVRLYKNDISLDFDKDSLPKETLVEKGIPMVNINEYYKKINEYINLYNSKLNEKDKEEKVCTVLTKKIPFYPSYRP